MKEMVGGCCVCSDETGWQDNPLVYCDGKNCCVAVHQACYGIVSVPSGPWFCQRCEEGVDADVCCALCPSSTGAMKRTQNGDWVHIICALYIPEVEFTNVKTMQPVITSLIPAERFNKVCYLCSKSNVSEAHQTWGACMSCHRQACTNHFHVTCAHKAGLLCEFISKSKNHVKYAGFCHSHFVQKTKGIDIHPIPAYSLPPTSKKMRSSARKKAKTGLNDEEEEDDVMEEPCSTSWSLSRFMEASSNKQKKASSGKQENESAKAEISLDQTTPSLEEGGSRSVRCQLSESLLRDLNDLGADVIDVFHKKLVDDNISLLFQNLSPDVVNLIKTYRGFKKDNAHLQRKLENIRQEIHILDSLKANLQYL